MPEDTAPAQETPESPADGGKAPAAGAAAAAPPPEGTAPEKPAEAQPAEEKQAAPPPPAGKRILVVEDSKPLRRMLEKLLVTDGHSVTPVENGKEALDKLRNPETEPFDLMVLDLMMPVMDGIQTMGMIKKESIPAPPVVICSSRSDRETVQLVSKLGAVGYILKPFKTETVQAKIRQALAQQPG